MSGIGLIFVYLGIIILPQFCVCAIIVYCTGVVRCPLSPFWVKDVHRNRQQQQQQQQQQRQQQQQQQQRQQVQQPLVPRESTIVNLPRTRTAQVNNEVAASAQANDVRTSRSHHNLRVTSSLPTYEDAVAPQRRCVTPDPHMLLPTYDEAELMEESESYQGFCLRSRDEEINSEPQTMAPFLCEDASAPANEVLLSRSHQSLPACEDIVRM